MSKLTEKQIEEIKSKYASTQISHRALADEYGVSRTTINRILNTTYADKEREKNRVRMNQNRKTHKNKAYTFWLHLDNDADMIEKLDTVSNRQGYIKDAIRDAIQRELNEQKE